MQLFAVIDNMFGFIWKQPIHATLRQMRIVQIALILNSQYLLWAVVDRLKTLDPVQAAMAYATIAAALITQIWAAVGTINKATSKDE